MFYAYGLCVAIHLLLAAPVNLQNHKDFWKCRYSGAMYTHVAYKKGEELEWGRIAF